MIGFIRILPGLLLVFSSLVVAQVVDFSNGKWVDLTHEFSADTLYWPTAKGFHKQTVSEGVTPGGWYYTAYEISTAEHGGTHLDAPVHFARGRQSVEQIPLERLTGPGALIDISKMAMRDPDYQLSVEDIVAWESSFGFLKQGQIVLIRTGFSDHWPSAAEYLGTDQRGPHAVALLHFPGISKEAAHLLVSREVAAVGIDTASLDHGQSADFMAHRILYEANIPGFENVADLSRVPPRGAYIVAAPMKIQGGSGAPLRILAFIPEQP